MQDPVCQERTGLFHVAVRDPRRRELARAFQRIRASGYPVDSVVDDGPGEAVNVSDPDGNGVELSYGRPADAWPRVDGPRRASSVYPSAASGHDRVSATRPDIVQ